jgi:hypothetical protein
MRNYYQGFSCALFVMLFPFIPAFSQTEVEPWGNITGIRVDGQLMEFETNISLVQKDWSHIEATAKERQRPKFNRSGDAQIITTNIDSLYISEVVTDESKGEAKVQVRLDAKASIPVEGVYLGLSLPDSFYGGGTIQLNSLKPFKLYSDSASLSKYLQTEATAVRFSSPLRQMTIIFKKPVRMVYKPGDKKALQFLIPIQTGDLANGESITADFNINASGVIDRKSVTLTIHTSHPGRAFDGIGGNFRLQNPRIDPEVIDYCLKNMRVAWGRVEMPWRFWQPSIDSNPIAAAKSGKLNRHVQQSMEIAQRLYRKGIPVILTAWFPPQWAVIGPLHFRPGPDHIWGNALDHSKTPEIYESIGDYIQYLKDAYGVEIADFSFNESDLGINIRQTGEEHNELIKGLGAYFVSRGFKTKMLLGDNSDANSFNFILPAMHDSVAYPFIGTISFHSWRGWDSATLQKWADAATRLHLPLLVGEGSIDAAAWAYPAIFLEQTYALKEISLYTKLLSICQPESILQWQLTSDYSLLAGGGVYGDTTSPLHPTQRFWNLKQLASTPKGLRVMELTIEGNDISGAVLGDNKKGIYAIHLVNIGAARKVTLAGLPYKIKSLQVWVTDKRRSMQQMKTEAVRNGMASFMLDATCFTTLESGISD